MALMTNTTNITLYIAMPDKNVSDSVIAALTNYDSSFYNTINELISAAERQQPDLILCHQCLVENDQAKALETLTKIVPNTKTLIFGPKQAIDIQIMALKHGARGYFDQSLPSSKLYDALQAILHGEVWVERHVIPDLIDELSHTPEMTQEQHEAVDSLTPKEREVAKFVSHGATNKMIASNMTITERTVKAHLTTIFQKMDISDRLSLAILFRDLR